MARDTNVLLHGTLDLLVLDTLWGPMHGYGITSWIEQATKGELAILDSALYKAPHRQADPGAIATDWSVSDNYRRAKTARSPRAVDRRCAPRQRRGSGTSRRSAAWSRWPDV
jgi:hypothetical protein